MIALPPWVARLRLWLISAIVLLIVVVLVGRMSVSGEDVAVAPQPLPVAVFEAIPRHLRGAAIVPGSD